MIRRIVMGGAAAMLLVPMAQPAQAEVPSGKITVDVVTVMGSGCPAGSAAVAVSPDNTAFTVTYSQYVAEVAPGMLASDSRKNCQLSLLVHVPGGFTYAVSQADYRGYASLAKGAQGIQAATYYFQGDSATAMSTHTFNGPMEDYWQVTDRAETATLVFKRCGVDVNLNVNSSLRVAKGTSGNADSYMVMDSTDGSFSTLFRFAWQRC